MWCTAGVYTRASRAEDINSFSDKQIKKDDISILLPKLKINNYEIKRIESIKCLGFLQDENLTWKPHNKYIENKSAKNFGLLFKVKPSVNKHFLFSLYYSYIHSYKNYANVAWGSKK